jgi:hypothetical protein
VTELLLDVAAVAAVVAFLAFVLATVLMAAAVRARYGSLRALLSTPEEIVDSLLVHQKVAGRIEQVEFVIHQDGPSPRAFVLDHPETIGVLVTFVAWVAVVATVGLNPVTWLLLAGWCVLALRLVRDGLRLYYTRYVMTNFRVIRIGGILHRENFSIPWGRITDFAWDQNYLGRLLGYATIRIVTASEESGLKELKDLSDPEGFNFVFVRLVEQRQGLINLDDREDIGWLRDVDLSETWRDLKEQQATREVWKQRRSRLSPPPPTARPTRWR